MRERLPISGIIALVLGGLYFIVPLIATLQFSLHEGHLGYTTQAYRQILNDPQFRETLVVSLKLALETTIVSMLLMVPTVYWVHLKLPRARRAVEFVTVLPFVVPPIVLVVGLLELFRNNAPQWVLENFVGSTWFLVAAYVVLSFPFVYRALDAGIRAVDVHTLTEASQSLGAGWTTTLLRVILPNLRTAALSGALLTFAIVLGEYTIASLALFNTFPVYITYIGGTTAYPAAALTIISFAMTFAVMLGFLVLARGRRRTGGIATLSAPAPAPSAVGVDD